MDICYLKGVGEKAAARFARLGIYTVEQLLSHYPREYIDYSLPYPIASAPYDLKCVVKATVFEKAPMLRVRGGKKIFKVTAGDETASLTLTWFNTPYAADALKAGEEYLFYGKLSGSFATREMLSPLILSAAKAQAEPYVPIYPQTEGLTSAYIAKCIKTAFAAGHAPPETLPSSLIKKYRLLNKQSAVLKIHFPQNSDDIAAARRRLIFEELLLLQLGLLLLRGRGKALTSAVMQKTNLSLFWQGVPFQPTKAQERACAELCEDLSRPFPANRLLQGDVGSGKTLVAAAGIYAAHINGFQSVLMAPTELLAQQHATTLSQLLQPFGVETALLTSAVKGTARKTTLAAIKNGTASLIVGTHAVLTQSVEFFRLGLAVTDEQHRFGVRQRSLLAEKASHPHLLVMSATPIPRTLALIMFGDLDISVLDEMPKGRKSVKTHLVGSKKRRDMYGFLQQRIDAGEQVYIVCPLVEEGEAELAAATQYFTDVAQPLLPRARIGLMHGRLKAADKASVMQAFRSGELDVLVSTTVIEVGVDVPNASVMVIENAERYGLSALHQLRGRVGRGSSKSFCFLVSDHESETARARLLLLCQTSDGFEVARHDLETRGPGDFFGSRQHGLPSLQIASLVSDSRVLAAAQAQAHEILSADANLSAEENSALKQGVEAMFSAVSAMN